MLLNLHLLFLLLLLIVLLQDLLGLHLVLDLWLTVRVVREACDPLVVHLHLPPHYLQDVKFVALGEHLVDHCHLEGVCEHVVGPHLFLRVLII